MIKASIFNILFLATLCLAAVPALAWNDTGHKITGYIAWQRMTPSAREQVIKILRDAPEDSDLSAFYMVYGAQSEAVRKRDFFMLGTTWPDIVRDRSFENRYKKYHKGNWHYSDTFWTRQNGTIRLLPPPEDGGKALEQLAEFNALIRSKSSNASKAVAIAWIQHLIGDLHQPLHTSARVTDLEPKGDQGGNLFLLTPQGTPRERQENLHWFWDSIIDRNRPNTRDECDAEYMIPIAEKILKTYPYDKVRGRLAPGKFKDWIAESLLLAQEDVFSSDLVRFQGPSDKYKKRALRISEERLALAGYRMGDLFNDAFGQP